MAGRRPCVGRARTTIAGRRAIVRRGRPDSRGPVSHCSGRYVARDDE